MILPRLNQKINRAAFKLTIININSINNPFPALKNLTPQLEVIMDYTAMPFNHDPNPAAEFHCFNCLLPE